LAREYVLQEDKGDWIVLKITKEEVNGTIIGDILRPYQFWAKEPRTEYQTKRGTPLRLVYKGFFANDDQAIGFFRDNFPEDFKAGVEMRVFSLLPARAERI